jgi:hypothetical protein
VVLLLVLVLAVLGPGLLAVVLVLVLVPVLVPDLVAVVLARLRVVLVLVLLGSRGGIVERVLVLMRSISSSRVAWRRMGGISMLRGLGRGGTLIVSFFTPPLLLLYFTVPKYLGCWAVR